VIESPSVSVLRSAERCLRGSRTPFVLFLSSPLYYGHSRTFPPVSLLSPLPSSSSPTFQGADLRRHSPEATAPCIHLQVRGMLLLPPPRALAAPRSAVRRRLSTARDACDDVPEQGDGAHRPFPAGNALTWMSAARDKPLHLRRCSGLRVWERQ